MIIEIHLFIIEAIIKPWKMTIKNLLIIIPIFILWALTTLSLLEKGIENQVLNEGSGCSSCSALKAFKPKNKSDEN